MCVRHEWYVWCVFSITVQYIVFSHAREAKCRRTFCVLQGPQVSVDCASLEFGLVPLGTSSQLTLTLTSHTHTSLPILLRQAIGTQATLPSTSRTGCRDSETDVTVSGVHICSLSYTTVPLSCAALCMVDFELLLSCPSMYICVD